MPDHPHDTASAFAAYERMRHRLPRATFPTTSLYLPSLSQVADHYDGFLLDAFGVLNIGETAIPGAVDRMAELRARGKRLMVLTNAASYTRAQLLQKYHRLGFDFTADEVVSSRDCAALALPKILPGGLWAGLSAPGDDFADLGARVGDAMADPGLFDRADGFLFLSTARWTDAEQSRLIATLGGRPLVIANPDIVAPREDDLSLEPGLFGHLLLDQIPAQVHWFGKPFGDCFALAIARMGLPAQRIAMVGDTLHTDVLGGAAAGCGTVLVADHGLFRGHDMGRFIAQSGIAPDFVVATT